MLAPAMPQHISMGKIAQATLSAALLALLVSAALVQGQDVSLTPSSMRVVHAGDTVLFRCLSLVRRIVERIEWFINGTSLVTLSLNNVTTDVLRGGSNTIEGGTLVFAAVPVEYNMTRVNCRVNFTTGEPVASTTPLLLIQGLLDAVANAMACVSEDFSHVLLNWTSPFALIGASEITYCVDVVDLTKRRTLQSECMITMTQFTHAMPREFLCSELTFTVTPVNVVGNGTTSSVQQTDCSTNPLVPPELINVMLQPVPLRFLFIMSAPVCNAELRFEDVDTGGIITLKRSDVMTEGTSIFIVPRQLRENRDYNVTITASNLAGSATSRSNISTPSSKYFTPTSTIDLTTTDLTTTDFATGEPQSDSELVESGEGKARGYPEAWLVSVVWWMVLHCLRLLLMP